jgi:hypothetical protein
MRLPLFFFAALLPLSLSAQSPVLIPPPVLGGPIVVSTLNLLDITVQSPNPSGKHILSVYINYDPLCVGAFEQVSFLDIPELILTDAGNIDPAQQSSYDALWQYQNGEFQAFVGHIGNLPPGCYEVCYRYVEDIEGYSTSICIQFNVQSDFPFYLLTPFDQSVVEDDYPILSWTPYEALPNCSYQLTLTEIYPGQSSMEAIISNVPLCFESGLISAFLQYPPSAVPLEKCRHYVWRVNVFNGEALIKSSEIWQFDTKCQEVFNPNVANRTYHLLTDDADQMLFNVVGDSLIFNLNHPYEKIQNYTVTIESLNTNIRTEIKPVFMSAATVGQPPTVGGNDGGTGIPPNPVIITSQVEEGTASTGTNYCLIDLKALGFIPGDYYLLRASNQNNTYFLYFLYHHSM